MAEQAFGEGPYTIVQTAMAASLIASDYLALVDGGIEAVTIPTDLLYALEPPTLLEELP